MKVALCLSGHINNFYIAKKQILNLVKEMKCDVFCYTSDMMSCRVNFCKGEKWENIKNKDKSVINLYIPAMEECVSRGSKYAKKAFYGYGWSVDKFIIEDYLKKTFGSSLKGCFVWEQYEGEVHGDPLKHKWDHLRKNELYKIYECAKMMETYEQKNNINYDVVISSRFDVHLEKMISLPSDDKYIATLGGWPCSLSSNKRYFVPGFCYGDRDSMRTFSEIAKVEDQKKYTDKVHAVSNGSGPCKGAYLEPIVSHYLVDKDINIIYLTKGVKNSRPYKLIRGFPDYEKYKI